MIKFALITLSVLITFIIFLHIGIVSFAAVVFKLFDVQVFLYLLIWLFLISCLWKINFAKIQLLNKILIIVAIIAVAFSHPIIIKAFPSVESIIEIDYCLDKGGTWDNNKNKCQENL